MTSTASSRPRASRLRAASCAGTLGGDGERDASRPRAHLEHADGTRPLVALLGGRIHALERGVHQNLGLGARDEHAALALENDVAKRHLARHVLQRLARGATLDGRVHGIELSRLERLVKVDVELHAREPADVGEQPLGGEAGVLVPLALKVAARPVEHPLDRPWLGTWHRPLLRPQCVTAS